MGLREGIELGLSLSNAYNQDLKQRADSAYQEEGRQRQRGLWQATDQAANQGLAQIDQAAQNNSISGQDFGLATPIRDARVLRQGGYADERTQAPPEKLSFGPQYESDLDKLRLKANLARASGDANALLGIGDELKNLQLGAGANVVRNRIMSATPDELQQLAKQITVDKRNTWSMKVDPKTGMTTVSAGSEDVPLSRNQLGDLISARWRMKQGDAAAADEIAKIHQSFAAAGDAKLGVIGSVAKINNEAAKNISDAGYKAGMLGAAQTNAQANMIRAQRTGMGGGGGAGGGTGIGKPLPPSLSKPLLENQQNLRRAEKALLLARGGSVGGIKGDKESTGLKGMLPNQMLSRVDPEGVATRAAIADLGSLVIHDRSGAAVTAAEFPRLAPFIPTEKDDAETVQKKLKGFVSTYRDVLNSDVEYHRSSGYHVPINMDPLKADKYETVDSTAEAMKLPSGTKFIDANGVLRTRP
jgi:hypothetical protein